jgi:hypothetical protein
MDNVKKHFERQKMAVRKELAEMPKHLSVVAYEYTLDSFEKEAWGNKKWAPRSRGHWVDSRADRRGLLVQSGTLRAANRRIVHRNGFTIANATPYAQRHNEGFSGKSTQNVGKTNVRAHKRKGQPVRAHQRAAYDRVIDQNTPQRQFIGRNVQLTNKLRAAFKKRITKAMQV